MAIPTFKEVFKVIEINKWILGISDDKLHFRFYVFALAFFPVLIEELGYFITQMSVENLVSLAGLVPCISYCISSFVKLLSIVLNKTKVKNLVNSMEILYNEILSNSKKIKIVQSEIVFVKKLTRYFHVLNVTLASFYNFSTLVFMLHYYVKTKIIVYELPYPVVVPFSTDSWIPWIIVYVHSIYCGYICITYTVMADCLYYILVTNVCVNFSILKEEFQNLRSNNFTNFHDCIRCHQYLIKLSDDLEEIFSLPNFFNVLFGAIQICALGFCITAGEWSNIPGYLLFLSTVAIQLWAMSVFGENIITRSSQIHEAISNTNWYEMDMKTKKDIMFVIARSQKPQRLTAYLFSTVCLGSFAKIISNSWSYFSILRSSYKAEGK